MRKFNLNLIVLSTIVVYVTIHLIEEALGGFALWAGQTWSIPEYSVTMWLRHNYFFIGVLMIGYLIYRINSEKYLPFGMGVLIWGLINGLNHLIFTLVYLVYSPGLFTSIIFIFLAYIGYKQLKKDKLLTMKNVVYSIIIGILYWVFLLGLAIGIDLAFGLVPV